MHRAFSLQALKYNKAPSRFLSLSFTLSLCRQTVSFSLSFSFSHVGVQFFLDFNLLFIFFLAFRKKCIKVFWPLGWLSDWSFFVGESESFFSVAFLLVRLEGKFKHLASANKKILCKGKKDKKISQTFILLLFSHKLLNISELSLFRTYTYTNTRHIFYTRTYSCPPNTSHTLSCAHTSTCSLSPRSTAQHTQSLSRSEVVAHHPENATSSILLSTLSKSCWRKKVKKRNCKETLFYYVRFKQQR